jgi:hypothetical protein
MGGARAIFEMDVETLLKQLDVGQKKLHKELQQLKTTQNKRENHELSTDKSRHSINKSFNVALDRTIGSRDTTLDTSQYGGLDRRMREKSIKTPRRCSGNAMVCPGYDWVAGLMDVTSISYNEDWLRELKEFRQINHQDCYMPHQDILTNSEPNKSCDNHMTRETTPTTQPPTDIHSYYIGERLFPVPINCSCRGEILCPVCEDLFKPRPPTQPPLNVQLVHHITIII